MKQKTIVAAALGECVHIAGVINFLRLAELAGWKTIFLGPAVSIQSVIETARKENAEMVGVSYRLTPETGERLLGQFAEEASDLHDSGVRFAFGGTPPVVERAVRLSFFEKLFDGSESPDQVLAYLKGQSTDSKSEMDYPQNVIDRIHLRNPFPILRHHFGLPTLEATLEGIQQIAEANVIDVISLGTDQDAQENFFHPEKQDPRRKGAGGVPVRSAEDFQALYQASRTGNYPIMRAYSGSDDFIEYAKLLTRTINNAWCAIPLFWFNQMDKRGPWDLQGSIAEHQKVMAWYGDKNIPVELNEPHHWGMRDSSDVVFVAAAYLSAYNARKFGVKDYIAQMMFNCPPGTADAMDLAKMLALLEMIEPLTSHDAVKGEFRIWRQTRIGLLSHPVDLDAARGHLAASTYLQMSLKPHIYHIVGHTEANHAATAPDVIEASKIVRRAITDAQGAPNMALAPEVQARKEFLIEETWTLLKAIQSMARPGVIDPWCDPETLTRSVALGLMDAPQLRNNQYGRGQVKTQIIKGACQEVDDDGKPISQKERIAKILSKKGVRK